MDAFPADIRRSDGELPTGMICPDCGGNLVVQAIGDDGGDRARLVFSCRVGHVYGVEEMLIGKEAHIEHTMWAAVFAYEELVAILRNLLSRGGPNTDAVDDDQCRRRIERAEQTAKGLRALIDGDESLRLQGAADD